MLADWSCKIRGLTQGELILEVTGDPRMDQDDGLKTLSMVVLAAFSVRCTTLHLKRSGLKSRMLEQPAQAGLDW